MGKDIIDVTSGTWGREVLQQPDGLVMVVFWARWCAPCLKMMSTLQEVAAECGDRVKVVRVDIDENPDVAKTYRVSIVPTAMFFREGQKVREIITNVEKTQLQVAIDSL